MAEGQGYATEEELAEAIDRLCVQWDRFIHSPTRMFGEAATSRPTALAPCVHALANTATLSAGAANLLLRREFPPLTAMPSIRLAFECAVTAQWLVTVSDALDIWAHGDLDKVRRLVEVLESVGEPELAKVAAEMRRQRLDDKPDRPRGMHNGSFANVLTDLAMNDREAYLMYAELSRYTHATVDLAETHVQDMNDVDGWTLTARPSRPDPAPWLHLTATSLVWAHSAAASLSNSPEFDESLRSTAARLGIDPTFRPSAKAMSRSTGTYVRRRRRRGHPPTSP